MRTASAPGKVVLSGEYAVLDGAPAVSVAVDRRAKVRITASENDWHSVTAPGFAPGTGRFVVRNGAVEWLEGGAEFGLVEAALLAANIELAAPVSMELDTREFVDTASGSKIGIGSSAALTVALLAALRRSTSVFADAIRAHRLFQKGSGSGVDVATAVHGGLIEFRADDAIVKPLEWPDGLACRFLWSGVAASTREKLAKLAALARRKSRLQLARSATHVAAAWHSADAVLQAFPAYIEDLRRFSIDHDLGIFDAGHEELASQAADAGLVYKPCGAGGGDIGVLLGASEPALDDFLAGTERAVDCRIDSVGVEQH